MNNTYAANATWTTCHVCQSSITDLWNITSSRLCHFLHLQTGRALFFFFFFGKHYYFWYLSSSNCLNTWKYNARQQEKLRVQPCLVCWSQARAWVWGGKYWVMHIPGFGIVWVLRSIKCSKLGLMLTLVKGVEHCVECRAKYSQQ